MKEGSRSFPRLDGSLIARHAGRMGTAFGPQNGWELAATGRGQHQRPVAPPKRRQKAFALLLVGKTRRAGRRVVACFPVGQHWRGFAGFSGGGGKVHTKGLIGSWGGRKGGEMPETMRLYYFTKTEWALKAIRDRRLKGSVRFIVIRLWIMTAFRRLAIFGCPACSPCWRGRRRDGDGI